MQYDTTVDPKTGLPKLNEGWTWEVDTSKTYEVWMYLKYNGKIMNLELVRTTGTWTNPSRDVTLAELHPHYIYNTAVKLLNTLDEYQIRVAKRAVEAEARKAMEDYNKQRYGGHYPPNTLN